MENEELLDLKSVLTPSDGTIVTWEQQVAESQAYATEKIREWLLAQEELSKKALPKWCMALVGLMGYNRFTLGVCSLCVELYRIKMVETKFEGEPNARKVTVMRGKRVIGAAELHIVKK